MRLGELPGVLLAELQVVLGAVACCLALARLGKVELPVELPWTLALAVAAIYAADRWLDVRRLDTRAPSARHRLAQDHPREVAVWIALLIVAGAVLALRLPAQVRHAGVLLALGLGVYLAAVARRPRLAMLKEPFVALGYVTGVALGPLALGAPSGLHSPGLFPALAGLAMAALANLMIFATRDLDVDRRLGVTSLVARLGPERSETSIVALILAMGMLAVWGSISLSSPLWRFGAVLLGAMALSLEIARRHPNAETARLLADAVFLLPAAILLFDG